MKGVDANLGILVALLVGKHRPDIAQHMASKLIGLVRRG